LGLGEPVGRCLRHCGGPVGTPDQRPGDVDERKAAIIGCLGMALGPGIVPRAGPCLRREVVFGQVFQAPQPPLDPARAR
jgi:hypothetical protein